MYRRPSGDQRGETTTQLIVMIPALMLLVLIGVQSAIWFHVANVAQVAAARGAAAASSSGASDADATSEAEHVVAENNALLRSTSATRQGDLVRVTVTLGVPHLVPFFPDAVSRTQVEPVERFISEGDRAGG